MTAPGIQERLRLARLELFAVTGATHQWSGPEDVNPIPGLREDVLALLRGQQEEAHTATDLPREPTDAMIEAMGRAMIEAQNVEWPESEPQARMIYRAVRDAHLRGNSSLPNAAFGDRVPPESPQTALTEEEQA